MLSIENLPKNLENMGIHRTIAPGQILFQQGDPTQHIFWVEFGRLKLVSFTAQQMIIHYFVEAGDSFAETALYFDTYGCTAIADQPCQLLAIPKQVFLAALSQSPTLTEQYLAHLTRRFSAVKQLLELRSIRSVRDRLLHYLLQQRQPEATIVPLHRSLKNLAMELGLSPEVLSRNFARLEQDGILTRKRHSITFNETWLSTHSGY